MSSNTSNWKLYAIASMFLAAVLFCGVIILYFMANRLDNKAWSLEKQLDEVNNSTLQTNAAIQQSLEELTKNGGDLFSTIQLGSNPSSLYVMQGDRFETDLFLTSSIPLANNTDFDISVNGKKVPVKDGKATYLATANSTGKNRYSVSATITNPITGTKKVIKRDFEYQVGFQSTTVTANKMNVFYIGVDNPISISAPGVSSNQLKVNCTGCKIRAAGGSGNYSVTVTRPGEVAINVSGDGLTTMTSKFRAKRIPDPVARLGRSNGGAMGNGEFKAQGGVGAFLDNFDFDAKCMIQGFNLTYAPKREEQSESVNAGARYNTASKKLIGQAKPGDTFYYTNVKAKCPGDKAGRKINTMVFRIR